MLLVRSLAALALLAVGAGGGLAAALLHESWWGLLLGLAAATSATRALRAGGMRFAFMLGWFGAIVYILLPRPEGDYLIPGTAAGYALLGGSFVLFLAALATLPRPGTSDRSSRQARRRDSDDDPVVSAP